MRSPKNNLAVLAFAFVGIVWGSNFIFMKLAAQHITPMQVVFVRVLFGFVPVALYAAASRVFSLTHIRHFPHFLTMGFLATVIYYFGFAKGTSLLSSGIAGAISGAIPLFSLLSASLMLKKDQITKWKVMGSILGFVGVVILARPFDNDMSANNAAGVGFMLLGALSVGVSFVYAKRYITPLKLSPLALTTYQLGAGLFILAFLTDFTDINNITSDFSILLATLIGLGLLGTGAAYICYYFIIEHLGALAASTVTYIPPVVALAIGAAIVNEPIELRDYAATFLILIAVAIANRRS